MSVRAGSGSPARPAPAGNSPISGYVRFRKQIDFGNTSSNCFDFDETISFIASPVVISPGPANTSKKGLIASPVFIVDPCQAGNSPLKTQTVLSSGFTASGSGGTDSIANANTQMAGVYTGKQIHDFTLSVAGQWSTQWREEHMILETRIVSAVNTAVTIGPWDSRNLAQFLSIDMVTSAGTATVTVSASVDSINFLQIDAIAAAAATDLQYTQATNALNGAAQAGTVAGTGASTVKLNPLAFRNHKIVIGAAGIGNTTTTTVSMK